MIKDPPRDWLLSHADSIAPLHMVVDQVLPKDTRHSSHGHYSVNEPKGDMIPDTAKSDRTADTSTNSVSLYILHGSLTIIEEGCSAVSA